MTVCLLSGAAGLAYQVIWSKLLTAGLGHEFAATAGVVSAFMLGMACGNLLAPWILRITGSPSRGYGACEMVLALWGMLSPRLLAGSTPVIVHWIGLAPSPAWHYLIAFATPQILLFPAAVALGATFPALEAWCEDRERSIPLAYAVNTFGGVVGIFLALFWILPNQGLAGGARIAAIVNLICGTAACAQNSSGTKGMRLGGWSRDLALLGAIGALAMMFEILAVRVLGQILENTVYSYGAVLAAFLSANAAGAWFLKRGSLGRLLPILPFTLLLAAAASFALAPSYEALRSWLGDSRLAVAAAEYSTALIFLSIPCAAFGGLFASLVQRASARSGVPMATAANLAGASAGPVIASALLLSVAGVKSTLALLAAGCACANGRWRSAWPGLAAAGCILLLPGSLMHSDLAPGERIAASREGHLARVTVIENARGERVLRVNNRLQMGGTAAAGAEQREACLPLLLNPNARRALFLGVGTGITLGAAGQFAASDIEGVELLPEILQLLPEFNPANLDLAHSRNTAIHAADARRFIHESRGEFDLIVADVFHPGQDGAGSLYSLEHYRAVRDRLAKEGLFCHWIPLHQVSSETLRTMIRTFQQVFPAAEAWLLHFNVDIPVLGLFSRAPEMNRVAENLKTALAIPVLGARLKALSLTDSLRLFGHFAAGPAALSRFSAGAALNTDDSQAVTFQAPIQAYLRKASSTGTLMAFLESVEQFRRDDPPLDPVVSRYLQARNSYLEALVWQSRGERDKAIAGFVESARRSPEFTPGYAQVLTLASLLMKEQPAKARSLLQELIAAQPTRPVARQLLEQIDQKSK